MADFTPCHTQAVSFWKQQESQAMGKPTKANSVGSPGSRQSTPSLSPVSSESPKSLMKVPKRIGNLSVFKSKKGEKPDKSPELPRDKSTKPDKEKRFSSFRKNDSQDMKPKEKDKEKDKEKEKEKEKDKDKDKDKESLITKAFSPRSRRSKTVSTNSRITQISNSQKSGVIKKSKEEPVLSLSNPGISPELMDVPVSAPIPNNTEKLSSSSPKPEISTPEPHPTGRSESEPLTLIAPSPVAPPKKSVNLKDQREHVVYEIYETEIDYVQDLETIVELYLVPLRESKIISSEDINKIFSTVELLLPLHHDFLKQISKSESVCKIIGTSSDSTTIGGCFMTMSQYLKMYSQYCSNQPLSHKTTEHLKKKQFGIC